MRPAYRSLLISVLAAGALAGCGHHRAPPAAPAPARLDEATVDMITNTGDYAERRHRVDRVDVSLTRQCMSAAGFAWAGVADRPQPDPSGNRAVRLDYARRHGYGLSDGPAAPGPESAGPEVGDGLRTALLGPANDLARLDAPEGVVYSFPRQGCAARSHIAVYGDLDTWARIAYLPQEFNLRLESQAKADPRYTARLREWSSCLDRKHYSYESPTAVVEQLTAAYRTDRRTLAQRRASEIEIAVQDVLCDFEVRLSATALELRREYAQRLAPADRAELTRLSTLFGAAEQRSRTLSEPATG
ncbi:hypothetical protein [Couchioplanes azureus]|uniref:hypothetical protein n=1 Tax=Couchioplanes caeruleus TaxID=56438 RepID=UPI001670014E|nr:hypothetical protein [Couchioplanes caeruleus]GGQ85254.1 hypothetical protein GCM10010166_64420 [Couchioplanes caeruleus subsp. azureus]